MQAQWKAFHAVAGVFFQQPHKVVFTINFSLLPLCVSPFYRGDPA